MTASRWATRLPARLVVTPTEAAAAIGCLNALAAAIVVSRPGAIAPTGEYQPRGVERSGRCEGGGCARKPSGRSPLARSGRGRHRGGLRCSRRASGVASQPLPAGSRSMNPRSSRLPTLH